jgi:hypothetical protein
MRGVSKEDVGCVLRTVVLLLTGCLAGLPGTGSINAYVAGYLHVGRREDFTPLYGITLIWGCLNLFG